LPTREEYAALDGNSNPGGGVWTTTSAGRGNLVNGRFFGKRASACTYPSDMVGCVFIPASGYRQYTTGALTSKGSSSYTWTSMQINSTTGYGFSATSSTIISYNKAIGFNVRCVR